MSRSNVSRASAQADAARVVSQLESIQRYLRAAAWAQARRLDVPLTPQQILALQVLVEHERERSAGLSLSELADRMGLAHSTTSGIVSRLEVRQLVQRAVDGKDRRVTRIELTGPVRRWVAEELPATRTGPIGEALGKASRADRAVIIEGLETLGRLLSESSNGGGR